MIRTSTWIMLSVCSVGASLSRRSSRVPERTTDQPGRVHRRNPERTVLRVVPGRDAPFRGDCPGWPYWGRLQGAAPQRELEVPKVLRQCHRFTPRGGDVGRARRSADLVAPRRRLNGTHWGVDRSPTSIATVFKELPGTATTAGPSPSRASTASAGTPRSWRTAATRGPELWSRTGAGADRSNSQPNGKLTTLSTAGPGPVSSTSSHA